MQSQRRSMEFHPSDFRLREDNNSEDLEENTDNDGNMDMETVEFSNSDSDMEPNMPVLREYEGGVDQRRFFSDSDGDDDDQDSYARNASDNNMPLDFILDPSIVPSSLFEARSKLRVVFDRTRWKTKQGNEYVLRVLREYPILASEQFEDFDNQCKHPLSLLLSSQACLDTIKEVYNMYPSAISRHQGSDDDLPLHEACWHDASSTDVIRFLAMEYPDALYVKNSYARLPIHDVLRSKPLASEENNNNATGSKAATIRFLVDSYPDCLKFKDDCMSILELAFGQKFDNTLLEYLIGNQPPEMNSFIYGSRGHPRLDQRHAQLLNKLLPNLSYFRCDPSGWTPSGFTKLMHSLSMTRTLKEMELLNLPAELMTKKHNVGHVFQQFMERTNLQKLTIHFPAISNRLENLCDDCLQLLADGLRHNTTLEQLELQRVLLSNASNLTNFLVTAQAPRTLTLERISFKVNHDRVFSHSNPPFNVWGRIERLIFKDCPMDHDAMENVLQDVAFMPSLKCLQLEFDRAAPGAMQLTHHNLTNALIAILQQNRLESLRLSSLFHFDAAPLCDALAYNTSLYTLLAPRAFEKADCLKLLLRTLQVHNTTLSDCGLVSTGRHDRTRENAIVLLRLNRGGRRKRARAEGTTKKQFVLDLASILHETSVKLPVDRSCLQYCLLKESPSLWST